MNRGKLAALGVKVGRIAGWVLLAAASLVLPAYFAVVSAPGRAIVSVLLEDEIRGRAEVAGIDADPFSGAVSLKGVVLQGEDDDEAIRMDAIELTPSSLDGKFLDRLLIKGLKVKAVLDEQGRLNLESLFAKKKKKKEPSEPKGFAVEEVVVKESTALFESPFLDVSVYGVDVQGAAREAPGGAHEGRVTASAGTISLTPKAGELADVLAAIAGKRGPYLLGPLGADAEWGKGSVAVHELKFALGSMDLRASGSVDIPGLLGQVHMSGWAQGAEAFSFSARLDGGGWFVALLVNRLSVPGLDGDSVSVPSVEVTGMNFATVQDRLTLSLKRLHLGRMRLGDVELAGLSVSSDFHYEGPGELAGLVQQAAAQGTVWDALSLLAKSWKRGRLNLLVLVDELLAAGKPLLHPLRLKLAGKPTENGEVHMDLEAALHPLGTLNASLWVNPQGHGVGLPPWGSKIASASRTAPHEGGSHQGVGLPHEGGSPYVATLKIASLDVSPIVAGLELPSMLSGMLSGTLSGSASFAAAELGAPLVKMIECRFELTGKNGTVVLECPKDGPMWDMSVDPEFSLFSREIRFGQGKVSFTMLPSARR